MTTRVIVDADYLVYAAGFAVEKTRYDITSVRPDGTEGSAVLTSRDEVEAWRLDEPEGSIIQVDKLIEAEPLPNALHLINRILGSVDTNLTQAGIEFDKLELVITGKGNFRDQIATIRGYKANRDPTHKPYHYKSIRRFLMNRWGARKVEGIEADDAVAMAAYEAGYDPEKLVIVSIDKDLLTIPGRHYHFKSKSLRDVTENESLVYFYRQIITGDAVDNIGGAYKAGPVMAERAIIAGMTEREMYDATLEIYKQSKGFKGCPYENLSPEAALLENARLLHLRRYENDEWFPPGERVPPARPGEEQEKPVIAPGSKRRSRKS